MSRASASRPAWGSSSSHSSGRRATTTAIEARRRWPADSRETATSRRRPSSPRATSAASASARLGARRLGPEGHVVGHRELVVEHGGVAEQARPGDAPSAGRAAGRGRAPRPCPRPRAPARRRCAAASSCRPRWGPGGARSRPWPRRDRPRPAPGTGPGARPRRGGGRRAPWRSAQGYWPARPRPRWGDRPRRPGPAGPVHYRSPWH